MATLEKIRNQAGLLVIVVGLALFAFIIGDFLNSGSSYFRQNQDQVANINGTPINVMEYQNRVDEMSNIYKMQSQTSTIPEEINAQIRQSVYDAMVQEVVMKETLSELGIQVTPDELFDMVQGNNISPMVQQFPLFMDPETGVYSKIRALNVLKTIENIESVPAENRAEVEQARQYWLFWERNMKMQRLQDKYAALLTKAIVANPLDARDAFDNTQTNSDIVYAMQSYRTIPDSTINVSDSEIKKLYNQRKEQYKQKEMRVLDYIAVDIRPSQDDYDVVRKDLEDARTELSTAVNNVADIVNEYSETQFVDVYVSESSMDQDMISFVSSAETGEIEGPVFNNQSYRVMKLLDKKTDADSVKVSQIYLATQNNNADDTAALADSLLTVLKAGGNFEEMAMQHSQDQTGAKGGEFGWFTEPAALGVLGEDFKNIIFDTPVNTPVILKSSYGTHIIKVTERTADVPKYKLAFISQSVTPSSKTQSDLYNALNQFIANNNTSERMAGAAIEAGYAFIPNVRVTTSDQNLGSIADARQVIRWAFEGSKKDEVSKIFESRDNFVVAIRKDILPEGYQSIQTVAPMLAMELRAKKKGEEIVKQLTEKNITTMDAYAQAMSSRVDTVRFVNMATTRIAGIGLEPVLNAEITHAPMNQLSKPIAGNNGVYVFNVFNRTQDSGAYDEKAQIQTLESSVSYRVGYMATQALTENAKIEDNRIRFE
ncbi:MAG: SurA N-terminal domain-containing protein [Tannerella sp.]|jgi:peptidyl-prolyl cis-trans isomerase D|nr:SurA N-terminal domain-containing protein [Tannerella sp.]